MMFYRPESRLARCAAWLARLTLWAGPFAGVLQLLLLGLVIFSLSRAGLMAWQWTRVSATGIPGEMLVQGVRADLIMLGYLIVLPVVLAPTAPAPSNTSSHANGTIVLEMGEVRVRIEGEPNAATLAQVLDRVLR